MKYRLFAKLPCVTQRNNYRLIDLLHQYKSW